jgi:6-phosphofructokinase 1
MHYVGEADRVLLDDRLSYLGTHRGLIAEMPAFELAGPRNKIFFEAGEMGVGIVTCGGLCPGLNNVVRGLVLRALPQLWRPPHPRLPLRLRGPWSRATAMSRWSLEPPHRQPHPPAGRHRARHLARRAGSRAMVDYLVRHGINVLFVIGGDGTIRGAMAITRRSPGAGSEHRRGRRAQDHRQRHPVHRPQLRLRDRLLGRGRGRSAAPTSRPTACQERHRPGQADGPAFRLHRLPRRARLHRRQHRAHPRGADRARQAKGACCATWRSRLERSGHAVLVVAEGAGQDMFEQGAPHTTDASGNRTLRDIGPGAARFASTPTSAPSKHADQPQVPRSQLPHPQRPGLALGQRVLLAAWRATPCMRRWPAIPAC